MTEKRLHEVRSSNGMSIVQRMERVMELTGLKVDPESLRCDKCYGSMHSIGDCPFEK